MDGVFTLKCIGMYNIPSGYSVLSYLESTGTQYIDTGFKPNQDTGISIDAQAKSLNTGFFFGARSAAHSNTYCLVCYQNVLRSDYATEQVLYSYTPTSRFTFEQTKNKVMVNGVAAVTHANNTFTCPVNLTLFAANSNGTVETHISMKLYSCQIYDNGTLVRDYLPVINRSGEYGLWDQVTEVFYGNEGTGTFTAGEIVYTKEIPVGGDSVYNNLPSDYTPVRYIKSVDGQAWIDTGVYGTQDTSVLIDARVVEFKSGVSYAMIFGCYATDNAFTISACSASSVSRIDNLSKGGCFPAAIGTRNIYESSKIKTKQNGVVTNTWSSVSNFTTSGTLYLGACKNSANKANCIELYECIIWDGDTKVRHFVPCMNNEGVYGMWDAVNSLFYGSDGSSLFEGGDAVAVIRKNGLYPRRRLIETSNVNRNVIVEESNYLCITPVYENGVTIKFTPTASCTGKLYSKIGKQGWDYFDIKEGMTYRFDTNTTIYFKGNLTCDGSEGIGSFSFSDSVNLSGNCMALLFMDDAANQFSLKGYNNVFDSLFYDTLVNNVSKTFLPATTLSDACYRYMFSECYYLNKIPDLPATTLKPDCYFGMFRNSSIIDPPTVPSTTTWADYACSNMFAGCSSLMTIASFNYAKLAAHCCEYMYSDCTALVTVKLTKMTQTKSHCCQYMFSNCTRLTSCYLYNHSSVAEYAYQGMFYKCSKLVTADVDISVSTLNSYALNSMFTECKNLTSIGKYEFTSVANSFKSPLSFMFYGCTSLTSIPKDAGFGFSCSDSLQYDNDLCRSMFYGCTKLSSVTCKIPLIDSNIFTNCKSLTSFTTTASIRPDGEGGFENCTSLTSLPTPFATGTQAFHGYMFRGCTALRNASGIQKLIATCPISNKTSWYNFTNCTSLIKGPLTIGPNTSGSYNYSGGVKMFSGCTSLTQSPEILDGTVGSGSGNQQTFSGTFENCSSLKYIKCLISNPQSDYNGRFLGWVDGVPSTGIFIKAPGAEWTTGRSGIPEGWVVVDDGTVETVEIYRSYAECPHHRIVFESGMTWREWINSKYNVFGYKITSTGGIECEYKIPNISDSFFWLDEDPDSIISAVAKYIEYGAP